MLFEYLINGVLFGGTYSLVAIGFTIIFGVMHRLNVAHGATIMVSAYAGATVMLLLGGDSYPALALAFVASIAAGAALGWLVELVAFRPLRGASYLAPFATTVGVTIVLEEVFLQLGRAVPIFYPEYTPFPSPLENLGFLLGDYYVRGVYLVSFVVAVLLMLALHAWVTRSRTGRAMRVVEENVEVAKLMGIDVRRTEVVAFVVASGLAGAAGCLIGASTGAVSPFLGVHLLLISFVVVVIGGLGNLYGAMIGGIIVGAVETTAVGLISASYKQAVLFAVLFAVLILRPEGILSRRTEGRD